MSTEIHHLAVIACDLNKTINFYSTTLGLRVLYKAAHLDGPRVCHFYWDKELNNFITFYHCPGLIQGGRRCIDMIRTISFSVNLSSLAFWIGRLKKYGISYSQTRNIFTNELAICLKDPDGLPLELVFTISDNRRGIKSRNIPGCFSIKGIYKIEIFSGQFKALEHLLVECFRFKHQYEKGKLHRFAYYNRPGSIIDVQDCSNEIQPFSGSGLVHHVAFDIQDKHAFAQLFVRMSQAQNRLFYYKKKMNFSSFYFQEPNGMLFEAVTQLKYAKGATITPIKEKICSRRNRKCPPPNANPGS